MPTVIFVTAYDQHALRAFEVHAIDYLLKPFDRERFREALGRARHHVNRRETGDLGRRLLALVKDLPTAAPKIDRLVVKAGGRLFFLRTDEIDWIEAAGNYARLHVGAEAHLIRETMQSLESRLDAERFFRIPPLAHRQHGAHPGAAALVQQRVPRHPPATARGSRSVEAIGRSCRNGWGKRSDAVAAVRLKPDTTWYLFNRRS